MIQADTLLPGQSQLASPRPSTPPASLPPPPLPPPPPPSPVCKMVERSGRYADVNSFDELQQKLKSRRALSLFWDETLINQDLTSLKQFSTEFAKYRVQIEQNANPSIKLQTLFQLEKARSSDQQDLIATLMRLFREKADRHFHPTPSEQELQAYFKAIDAAGKRQLDIPWKDRQYNSVNNLTTKTTIGVAGMIDFPDDPVWLEEELAWVREHKKSVTFQVAQLWNGCGVQDSVQQKEADFLWGNTGGPVLKWFGHVLGQSACKGKFEFFNRLQNVTYHDHDVQLHWCVLGWNVEKLLALNNVLASACVCPCVETMVTFETLGTEVMGAFAIELVQVQTILEHQQSIVQGVKNKVLAGMVSGGIAVATLVANVVGSRITKAWNSYNDSD